MNKSLLFASALAALCLGGAAQAAPAPSLDGDACLSALTPYTCSVGAPVLARADATFVQLNGADFSGTAEAQESESGAQTADAAAAPVPEPQTLLMMLIGLVLLGFTTKRQEAFDTFTS